MKVVSEELKERFQNDRDALIAEICKWITAGDLDLISQAIAARYAFDIKVRLPKDPQFHCSSSAWTIVGHTTIFEFNMTGWTNDLCFIVVHRWICMMDLFKASHRDPFVGTIIVNYNDAGIDAGIAFCANRDDMLLVPDPVFTGTHGYFWKKEALKKNAFPWEKKSPKAFWRGSTTGKPKKDIFSLPRVELALLAKANPDLFDIGITSVVERTAEEAGLLRDAGLMIAPVPNDQFDRYKLHIDIDGHSNAWSGLMDKLLSGGAVMKVTSPYGYRQWYYDRLEPWRHFVPIKEDMSDLVAVTQRLMNDDELARSIAIEGQRLAFSLTMETEMPASAQAIRRFTDTQAITTALGQRSRRTRNITLNWLWTRFS